MDELKIKSKLLTNIVSKIIRSTVKKKLGYDIDIQLHELTATINDGKAHVYINAEGDVDVKEFKKFTKVIGLED